jgi:hypothetical protein
MPINKTTTEYAGDPSEYLGERKDCSVRALAVATGMGYAKAHAHFEREGRRFGRGTSFCTTATVHDSLGLKLVPLAGNAILPMPRYRPTLAQFLRKHPRGRFVLHRSGHAFAVIDGVVHDWATGTGARTRVWAAWQVNDSKE